MRRRGSSSSTNTSRHGPGGSASLSGAFDRSSDYRRFVDGKPRYEGVASFLGSRGIELPFGSPEDPEERETVCGLGNRKNRYFREALATTGSHPYPTTLELIARLREQGVRTAIVSSSRNCAAVLEAAGIRELFDAKVDGVDAAELGLPGKPDPAVFLDAARRWSCSGADGGRRGRDRGSRGGAAGRVRARRRRRPGGTVRGAGAAGADVVVGDLGELAA